MDSISEYLLKKQSRANDLLNPKISKVPVKLLNIKMNCIYSLVIGNIFNLII